MGVSIIVKMRHIDLNAENPRVQTGMGRVQQVCLQST